VSGTFSVRGIGFRGGTSRELSTLSHREVLRVTCRILLRRDGALNPFVARNFSALFSITAVPRFSTTAFRIPGGPIFSGSTLGGYQGDPGHVNPDALLHKRRLRQPPNRMVRPKARRNTCLEARPYLQDSKRTQSRHHKSKAGRYDDTKAQVTSSHLSTQTNRFIKGDTGPTFGKEGVHENLG
jgi:hypothetical protein